MCLGKNVIVRRYQAINSIPEGLSGTLLVLLITTFIQLIGRDLADPRSGISLEGPKERMKTLDIKKSQAD